MKKLENYGVLEMDIRECKEVDGGKSPVSLWDVYFWLWSQAERTGDQNPGAGGYMGCKL